MIHHSQLRNPLSSWISFPGRVSEWFLWYMTNQKQSVKVLDSVSCSKELHCGIPQGTVLGPHPLTMYTAPLSAITSGFSGIKHHLYADDTQMYISIAIKNASTSIPQIQNCLKSVQEWMPPVSSNSIHPRENSYCLARLSNPNCCQLYFLLIYSEIKSLLCKKFAILELCFELSFSVCKVFKILSVVASLEILVILVLQFISKINIGFL